MSGYSKTIIVGHVGKDPDVKYLANGTAVCNISVATSETWKDKQTGEKVEKTEWHRCVVWGNTATFVENYVTKGSLVAIDGQNETRKWEDKDGQTRYTTEIKVRNLTLLSKSENKGEPKEQSSFREKPKQDSELDDMDIPF